MSHKPSTEEQEKELSWEEAVSRFLEQNPDYFQRHPEVLDALTIPHLDKGEAVSLIERQVQWLRDKNHTLSQQLRELITIARENDVLGERLHDFAGAMIESISLDEVLGTARDMLRQRFKLDAVVILLKGDADALVGRPEFVAPGERRLEGVLKLFAGSQQARAKPICCAPYDSDTLAYLFGGQAGDIRSTATMLLASSSVRGVLCLGSQDPLRFHPQMGTVYLSKLSELLMAGIARHL